MNRDATQTNPAILIMAKTPRAGSVKTRLRPFLSDDQCAKLAICFLKDAVNKAKSVLTNVIVAYAPSDGKKEVESLVPENLILIEQKGNDLGEKMNSAFEFAERRNFSPIIVTGTDSPDFPPEHLHTAINSFQNEQTQIVLGAARDGGYYLLGLRRAVAGIFENVEWSSEKTFVQTAENARKIFGGEPEKLPVWYDVDTPCRFTVSDECLSWKRKISQRCARDGEMA
jgi:rSAM/selenodomain-associated transferase 1